MLTLEQELAKAEYVTDIELDYHLWLSEMFPHLFQIDTFEPHQEEFWELVWNIPEDGIGSAEDGNLWQTPINIIGRGGGKSTQAETAVVMAGARNLRKVAMYITGTKAQALKHAKSIEAQLTSPNIANYYPGLSQRKLNQYGHSQGWNGQVIVTAWDFVIFFVSLDTEFRGARWEESRIDFFILDDIDSRHDTRAATRKKKEIITETLLPSGSPNAVTVFCQNLIHKDSLASQFVDDRAQWLSNRKVIGPIPLLYDFQYEKRQGRPGHDIIAGVPSWSGISIAACQKMVDDYSIDGFLRECQNKVDGTPEGALFAEFNEIYHVITWEEFAQGYGELANQPLVARYKDGPKEGQPRLPSQGYIGRYQDFGSTVDHPAVTGWYWKPSASLPLNRALFTYRELCLPEYPEPAYPPVPVSPGRIADKILELEREWNETPRIKEFKMSHEQSAALGAYNYDRPKDQQLHATKVNARKGGEAIPQFQDLLAIDHSTPHPFRKYPKGHPLEGQPLMGCPLFFIIVAKGQGELVWINKELKVTPAINAAGFSRARFEIPNYRNKVDSTGVEIDKPDDKKDDDWIDMNKMAVRNFGLMVEKLTEAEMREASLHENYRIENIIKMPVPDNVKEEFILQRQFEIDAYNRKSRKKKEGPVYNRPNMTSFNKFTRKR